MLDDEVVVDVAPEDCDRVDLLSEGVPIAAVSSKPGHARRSTMTDVTANGPSREASEGSPRLSPAALSAEVRGIEVGVLGYRCATAGRRQGDRMAGYEANPKDAGTVGGGRSDRGPNPDPGGETDLGVEIPPYADRLSGPGDDPANRRDSVERQLAGQPAPQDTVQPVGNTEAGEPEQAPPGVGESMSRRGEDIAEHEGKERGRKDTGSRGESDRPTGESDADDATGVDPQER